MKARLPCILIAGLGLLGACSKDPTQIIVLVDSDLAVPSELLAIRAVVRWEGEGGVADHRFELGGDRMLADRTALPFSFGIGPAGASDGAVTVELHALRPGDGLHFVRRTITRFRPNESLLLPMFLAQSCLGSSCMSGQTCTEDGCKAEIVDPATLQVIRPGAELEVPIRPDGGPRPDAGEGRDATPPSDAEVGVDADATVDEDAGVGMDAIQPGDGGDAGTPPRCGRGLVDGESCGPLGFRCCGGACVDTNETVSACGAQCQDCGANSRCDNGRCVCVAPYDDCDDEPGCEADLTSDSAHCSQCLLPCETGTSCIGGSCLSCIGDGDCVDDTLVCTGPPRCEGGECERPIAQGWCLIGGACYSQGATNPSNPCQICNTNDPYDWSPNPGQGCNDGRFCTANDVCDANGACLGSGSPCLDATFSCVVSTCDEAGGCVDTVQGNMCAIGNACVAMGTRHPSDPCLVCLPGQNPWNWSVEFNAPCDDGLFCTQTDRCDTAGVCRGMGTPCVNTQCGPEICNENTNSCQVVNPFTGWCYISSMCVPAGAEDPMNNCFGCQPQVSRFSYTQFPDGTGCGFGNVCCSGQCILSTGGDCTGGPVCPPCVGGEMCQCNGLSCICCPIGQTCI